MGGKVVATGAHRSHAGRFYPAVVLLTLMRHAKSDHPAGLADIDRPLSKRGTRDAGIVGSFLATAIGSRVDLICSPARRARDTAAEVCKAAGWEAPRIDDRLYYGGVGPLLEAVAESSAERVVAFGHEPVWSTAVSTLVGGGRHRMVTAAAAGIEIADPLQPGFGSLLWLVSPASLGGGKRG